MLSAYSIDEERRRRTRATAAAISSRIVSGAGIVGADLSRCAESRVFAVDSVRRRPSRATRAAVRLRHASVSARAYSGQGPSLAASGTATRSMQSTGHGGRQSSQPLHCAAITVCIHLCAPTIASTGQASMHLRQPMQRASSITARRRGSCAPNAGSSGFDAMPSCCASSRIVASPPGGHWLMSASPRTIACA